MSYLEQIATMLLSRREGKITQREINEAFDAAVLIIKEGYKRRDGVDKMIDDMARARHEARQKEKQP